MSFHSEMRSMSSLRSSIAIALLAAAAPVAGVAAQAPTASLTLADALTRAEERPLALLMFCFVAFVLGALLIVLVAHRGPTWLAPATFSLAFAFFALGETLVSPTIGTWLSVALNPFMSPSRASCGVPNWSTTLAAVGRSTRLATRTADGWR